MNKKQQNWAEEELEELLFKDPTKYNYVDPEEPVLTCLRALCNDEDIEADTVLFGDVTAAFLKKALGSASSFIDHEKFMAGD